jgi:hypothetical protein
MLQKAQHGGGQYGRDNNAWAAFASASASLK